MAAALLLLALSPLTLAACGSDSADTTNTSQGKAAQRVAGFGVSATAAESRPAEAALLAYLTAASKGQWAKACSYLAEKIRRARARLAAARQLESDSCAAGLRASAQGLSKSERADLDQAEVSSVRVKGKRGYVLYKDGSDVERAMPIVAEGGDWKLLPLLSVPGIPARSG